MHTIIRTYKFKLYKNKKNKYLDDGIDIAASIWNYCIAVHRRYYRLYGKHLSANKLKKHITKVKKTLHPEWQALGSQAIQDVVERVDRSYKAFFDHVKQKRHGRKSPPSFKKRSRYSSFTLKQAGYAFYSDNRVTIMGREYKYCKSRTIEGEIKTLTVKRNVLGDFYLIAVTKQECNDICPRAGKAVGMDFGLKRFLNLDDGSVIDSPQWYKASLPSGIKPRSKSCEPLTVRFPAARKAAGTASVQFATWSACTSASATAGAIGFSSWRTSS